MTKSDNSAPSRRSSMARAAAIAGLAAAAVAVVSPAAMASGTSNDVNGCYSTWGSTGSNAHCKDVTATGFYRNAASCNWSLDQQSAEYMFLFGSSKQDWGQVDCTFKINFSWVNFRG
ncbi:hypothetical protein [Kitasatospora sp. NPDC088351]|uniref:hypothetical protein n=1 Tax=unclassified Kitasatospora TaxID=2633591 RepID=UPI00342CE775